MVAVGTDLIVIDAMIEMVIHQEVVVTAVVDIMGVEVAEDQVVEVVVDSAVVMAHRVGVGRLQAATVDQKEQLVPNYVLLISVRCH